MRGRTMTHDELLTKIEKQTVHIANKIKPVADSCEKEIGEFANALRAVVELHKPMLTKYMEPDVDRYECQVCREEPYYSRNEPYPCPTIQAIEKELG